MNSDKVLRQVVVDGMYGAVAGLAGTIALTGTLLLATLVGAFDLASFGTVPRLFGLDAVLSESGVLALGYVVFLAGGSLVWPLVLATLGSYLPGENYATRGLFLGGVLWTGFSIGFNTGVGGGIALPLYAVATFVGHLGYGFVTGAVFDRLFVAGNEPFVASLGDRDDRTPPAPGATGGADTADGTARTGGGGATARETGADAAQPAATAASGGSTATGSGSTSAGTADPTRTVAEATSTAEASGVPADPAPEAGRPAGGAAGAPVVVSEEDMPPLLQFEQALDKIEAAVDDLPPSFMELREAYEKLRAAGENRNSRVSDFNARLSAVEEDLPETRAVTRWIDSMENRIDLYLDSRRRLSSTLHLSGAKLFDDDGDATSIGDLQSETATLRVTVANGGDRAAAVARVEFYNDQEGDRILVRADELPMGAVGPGDTKTMETRVYVPSIATSFDVIMMDPRDGQTFLANADKLRSRE